MTARERLARQQGELLRALLAGGATPRGFDADRVRAEAILLRDKRRRVLAYIRPDIRDELDDRFAELFEIYAAEFPRFEGTRARHDADRFAGWLIDRGDLKKPKKRWSVRNWVTAR